MKIVMDLQCCQTAAQSRGMGRYSLSLMKEIVRLGKRHDFVFLLNHYYLDTSATLIGAIEALGKLGNVILQDYPGVQYEPHERLLREQVADLLRNDRIDSCSPDVYHVCSLFEGESVYGRAAAYITLPKTPLIRSATIYDFIPALYPEKYLGHWPVALWYRRTLGVAQHLDIALAISDATKKDAERLLQLDAAKVINIFGSVDDCFRVLDTSQAYTGEIWDRLDSTQPFFLYVGGPDFRKNLAGTLEAFALANKSLQNIYKLVIVYDIQGEDLRKLRERAGNLGIAQQVVTTGYVSDDELVQLYNACSLFIFPSLYEGLGLPVIEAMRCNAPVIVGDNSSLPEIVHDRQYRFDASNPADIAQSILRAMTQPGALDRMRAYGRGRAAKFTWEESARRALDAWEEAFAERKGLNKLVTPQPPRIAMFTPLPAAKTGIADYSAEFIPSLSKYALVDVFVEDVREVTVCFSRASISHHSQFPFKASNYDAIIYQLGNSPYHHYMLPYITKYPGVVVLHDAYLGHLSHDPGNPEPFIRQIIHDHGGRARGLVLHSENAKNAARELIEKLSCSPTHVHRSLGVIVHSQFARDILTADSHPGIAPQVTILPQYKVGLSQDRVVDKAVARRKLGISRHALLIISVGHVTSTKGILELIEAFDLSRVGKSKDALLIFVGELEGGSGRATPFAQQTLTSLKDRHAIKITGFVNQNDYDLYLAAADFGVQLRTITRGETSRALLDLLTNGVPFIYNRLGASCELPAEAALALETFAPRAICDAIDLLGESAQLRQSYARAALKYSKEVFDPDKISEEFIRSALVMTSRARACGPSTLANNISQVLRDAPLSRTFVKEIAASYVRQEHSEFDRRLLIDVTHIREADLKTGVQRVVRELTRAAYSSSDLHLRPQAFAFTESGLTFADDYAQNCGARAPVEAADALSGAMDLRPFDKILMADGTWHLSDWMHEPIDRLNLLGGSAFGLVHDILPLQHPKLFQNHVAVSVTKWLSLLLEKGSGVICTSLTGADALIDHIVRNDFKVRRGLRIGCVRLGRDFSSMGSENTPIQSVTAGLVECKRVFLMVGTIEPRKGHGCVLDAFEQLWASDVDATLVFAGKLGWEMNALKERMEAHPERNKRFFFLGFAPDADVRELYKKATGVIVGSIAEGFGLPIYETALFGTPLLLSDLPVFKELAGDHAQYFKAGSSSSLADLVRRGMAEGLTRSSGIAALSWKDCAERVFEFMRGDHTYHLFGEDKKK